MTAQTQLYQMTRVATSAAVKATPGRIMAVLLYGTSDAASITFYDAASATGTAIFAVVAPFTDSDASAAFSVFFDFTNVGGITFPTTGIYATLAGTSAVANVWWD